MPRKTKKNMVIKLAVTDRFFSRTILTSLGAVAPENEFTCQKQVDL
jgi:hypothetical protein